MIYKYLFLSRLQEYNCNFIEIDKITKNRIIEIFLLKELYFFGNFFCLYNVYNVYGH